MAFTATGMVGTPKGKGRAFFCRRIFFSPLVYGRGLSILLRAFPFGVCIAMLVCVGVISFWDGLMHRIGAEFRSFKTEQPVVLTANCKGKMG